MASRTRPAIKERSGRSIPRVGAGVLIAARQLAVQYLPPVLLLVVLLLVWEWWVRYYDVKPYLLPAPSRIWSAFLEIRGTLPHHTRVTLIESIAGLGVGIVVGVALAVVIASVPLVRRVLFPLLVVSQTIPMVALAPLLIIWFGFGLMPKVIVVALVGFFPIVVSTVEGLTNSDPEMIGLVRSMGASRFQVMRYVRIPGAMPSFFAGLKIAAAYAVTGAVVGEWVAASDGLGVVINRSRAAFRIDRVFVAITIISLASIALFGAVQLLARLASPWMYVRREEDQ
jgi:ABC-type nitrate/sulfonate/bicarbonate transport system permease component